MDQSIGSGREKEIAAIYRNIIYCEDYSAPDYSALNDAKTAVAFAEKVPGNAMFITKSAL